MKRIIKVTYNSGMFDIFLVSHPKGTSIEDVYKYLALDGDREEVESIQYLGIVDDLIEVEMKP